MTRFIDEHRDQFGVEPICTVMEFAVSTYHAAKKREAGPSRRAVEDEDVLTEIRRMHHDSGRLYGAAKV
jgi:putative transposase